MPKVPEYQSDVSTRPIFQQGIEVRATPDAFGASIGRGMQSAGRGIGMAGDAAAQIQALEDEANTRRARNEYLRDKDTLQYDPDKGYLQKQGKDAIDGIGEYERGLKDLRRKHASRLTPTQQRLFAQAVDPLEIDARRSGLIHKGNATKAFIVGELESGVQAFADQALMNFTSPAVAAKYIAAGQLELRRRADLEGWGAETLKLREGDFVSGVHKNIALRIAQGDPIAANEYVKKNANRLTGAHQYDLTTTLENAVAEEQSKRETDAILSSGRKVADLPGDIVGEVEAAGRGGGGPTRSKAFLSSRSAHADRAGDTMNLDNSFADNLAALIQDAPPGIREGLGIGSGYRSNEVQERLFASSDGSGRKVAFPAGYQKPDGSIAQGSNHLHGRAVDLSYNGQRLDKAPQEVRDWVHQNARKYGMFFPMGYEPWHIEPTRGDGGSTVAARSNTISARATMPSYDDIETRLAAIADPRVRDLTRKRLYSAIEMQNKANEQTEKAARSELWKYVDQGGTPDQVPIEVRQAAGMAAVSSAWEYIEKSSKREAVESDEVLLYDMRRFAALKPEDFAEMDLNDYRDRLSKDAIKELTGLQTSALTDQRKAREEGLTLTTAFSQASSQLEAVGITTTGKEGGEREEAAKRIAQFQNALAQQMEEFKTANNGQKPTQMDIQSMVNRMLLPVVMSKSVERSFFDPLKVPGDQYRTIKRDGFLFEAGSRTDGETVAAAVEYANIPIELRRSIAADLERDLGRKPSEEEVIERYEDFVLGRETTPIPVAPSTKAKGREGSGADYLRPLAAPIAMPLYGLGVLLGGEGVEEGI
ncbi:M15 family metallopeptidase [Sinorhizobium meliloti]|uniref:M15 family metallopeptidase n=1 Tax=Rhizobium meliloti TaxID=382 RepID=UPI0003DC9C6D|nr:M15 family metallopeptidase [Sinorhizobium meliloti]ARS70117.1 hypothetical protein SMRU11_23995 [Sinorhizobium meliloti RU11/001]